MRHGEASRVIRLGLPDGRRLEVEHKHLWSVTTRLVAEHPTVAHAVSTAAGLRLALKALGHDGEIALDERQARAVLAVTGATLSSMRRDANQGSRRGCVDVDSLGRQVAHQAQPLGTWTRSTVLQESNAATARVAREMDGLGDQVGSDWRFVCECAVAACHALVELDLEEYETIRSCGGHVLAAGHTVSRSGPGRRTASELREDASR